MAISPNIAPSRPFNLVTLSMWHVVAWQPMFYSSPNNLQTPLSEMQGTARVAWQSNNPQVCSMQIHAEIIFFLANIFRHCLSCDGKDHTLSVNN